MFPFPFRRKKNAADTPPIVLTHRRIYILPTRTGMLFVAVLALMLTGAVNYNLSLGHALVFLLVGLFFVTILHTVRNLLDLRVSPVAAAPVFVGEFAKFPIFLENTRPESRQAFQLAVEGGATGDWIDVPANATLMAEASCPVRRRGVFRPQRLTLSSRYPLGLFRAWSILYPDVSCLVYPRPLAAPLPCSPFPSSQDSEAWSGENGQDDFAGLRLRQANESLRHVAWKAAARDAQRPLLSKRFSGGQARKIVLDWRHTAGEPDTETRLSILAGWILESESQRIAYGLRLPGLFFTPSRGTKHREACLQALALYV